MFICVNLIYSVLSVRYILTGSQHSPEDYRRCLRHRPIFLHFSRKLQNRFTTTNELKSLNDPLLCKSTRGMNRTYEETEAESSRYLNRIQSRPGCALRRGIHQVTANPTKDRQKLMSDVNRCGRTDPEPGSIKFDTSRESCPRKKINGKEAKRAGGIGRGECGVGEAIVGGIRRGKN